MLIGLAIAVKVTPVVFAAYFFWKRRWVVAASALAGVAFWSLAVPAPSSAGIRICAGSSSGSAS